MDNPAFFITRYSIYSMSQHFGVPFTSHNYDSPVPASDYATRPWSSSGPVLYRASPKYMVRSPILTADDIPDDIHNGSVSRYAESSRSLLRNPLEFTADGKLIDIRDMDADIDLRDAYEPSQRTYTVSNGQFDDRYPIVMPKGRPSVEQFFKGTNNGKPVSRSISKKNRRNNNMYIFIIVALLLYIVFDKMHTNRISA